MGLGPYTWWNNPYPPDEHPDEYPPEEEGPPFPCRGCGDDIEFGMLCEECEAVEEQRADEAWAEKLRQLENEAMVEHFRKHPHG